MMMMTTTMFSKTHNATSSLARYMRHDALSSSSSSFGLFVFSKKKIILLYYYEHSYSYSYNSTKEEEEEEEEEEDLCGVYLGFYKCVSKTLNTVQ